MLNNNKKNIEYNYKKKIKIEKSNAKLLKKTKIAKITKEK